MTERWPRRPPAEQPCDAHTGVSSDQLGQPVVLRCENMATETCKATSGMVPEVWLCEEHAETLADKGVVRRNPRLFK